MNRHAIEPNADDLGAVASAAPADRSADAPPSSAFDEASSSGKRPKAAERRIEILRTLATMLEEPTADRITTAALAARLRLSEAALYRHFASKAQMFEGLIDFIETGVFNLIEQIVHQERDPRAQALRTLEALLRFAESHPGMARVMVGDALVFEHARLLQRMNRFFDRIEAQLRQSLGAAASGPGGVEPLVGDGSAPASVLTAFALGRLQRFTRSGFKRLPTEHLDIAWSLWLR